MINKIIAKNFTVFRDAEFAFSKGINVVIGSNGTGKSHVLKLAYTAARWSQEMALREKNQIRPDKVTLQKKLGEKLMGVFRCETLGRLSTRGIGARRTEVSASFHQMPRASVSFSFSTRSSIEAVLEKVPAEFFDDEAVFFPTKEMLTMFPGFIALYDNYALQIDETYRDLCLALAKPLPRGRKLAETRAMLEAVEEVLGGSIQEQHGRFYLIQKGGEIEVPLLAEGLRKLGTVAYLLANGTLGRQSILFWDEPETNLNPAYMVKLAELLVAVAGNGTQLILATHSLFLMRELSLRLGLPENSKTERKFFSLEHLGDEGCTQISVGDSAESVVPIVALDMELEQSERYLQAADAAES